MIMAVIMGAYDEARAPSLARTATLISLGTVSLSLTQNFIPVCSFAFEQLIDCKCLVSLQISVSHQVQKELQERAKFEITGTRVLRQKLKRRFRVVGQVKGHLYSHQSARGSCRHYAIFTRP